MVDGALLALWAALFITSIMLQGGIATAAHIGGLVVAGCIGWSLERAGSQWFLLRRRRRHSVGY